jgi:F420-dependent oxidoreductase-like protein
MKAPIRLGLQIPSYNYPDVPPEALFERLTEIAATAESSGFDSLFVMDHLHQIPGVGPQTDWMLEGNTTLAALAARTERLQLGLMVGSVTYRNPALHAKITTTLDVISGGRAIYSLGAGWFEDEHCAYGFEFPPLRERFERLEEALQIARAMFTEDSPSFEGRHFGVDGVLNNPRPLRGDIPILVGGSGERKTLRLVAQYADACNIFGDPDRVRHLLGVLEGHCEADGRDPAEITKTRLGTLVIAPTHEEAGRLLAQWPDRANLPEERLRHVLTLGDPDEVGERVQSLFAAGLDGLVFHLPNPYDLDTVALAGETLSAAVASRA